MDIIAYALKRDDLIERFWWKVTKGNGGDACWEWKGRKQQTYGQAILHVDGKAYYMYAHRFSYALAYGDFDKSLVVCHGCDNSLCVNPKHLLAGVARDSVLVWKMKRGMALSLESVLSTPRHNH